MRWLLLVLLTTTAAAEPFSPTIYTARRVESSKRQVTRHASRQRETDIRITMGLRLTGVVDVEARGRESDRVELSKGGITSTDVTDITWATTWTGTWADRNGERVLDLELASETCTHVQTTAGGATQTLPCVAASKQATVACRRKRIMATPAGGKPATRGHAAWQCSVQQGSLGQTPVPWTAGDTTCLETKVGVGGKMTFVEC